MYGLSRQALRGASTPVRRMSSFECCRAQRFRAFRSCGTCRDKQGDRLTCSFGCQFSVQQATEDDAADLAGGCGSPFSQKWLLCSYRQESYAFSKELQQQLSPSVRPYAGPFAQKLAQMVIPARVGIHIIFFKCCITSWCVIRTNHFRGCAWPWLAL